MLSKIIHIRNIGDIHFIKRKNIKSIRILIHSTEDIKVHLPYYITFDRALEFVVTKKSWLKKHLTAFENKNLNNHKIENGVINTRNHEITFSSTGSSQLIVTASGNKVIITHPEHILQSDKRMQPAIQKALHYIYKKEAKEYLQERIKMLSEKHGLKFNKLFIKNMRSRWGSCSSVNNINLNVHLMKLPDELIDYVIIHELAHTIEKNHSVKYWLLLENLFPNSKQFDKQLKNFNI